MHFLTTVEWRRDDSPDQSPPQTFQNREFGSESPLPTRMFETFRRGLTTLPVCWVCCSSVWHTNTSKSLGIATLLKTQQCVSSPPHRSEDSPTLTTLITISPIKSSIVSISKYGCLTRAWFFLSRTPYFELQQHTSWAGGPRPGSAAPTKRKTIPTRETQARSPPYSRCRDFVVLSIGTRVDQSLWTVHSLMDYREFGCLTTKLSESNQCRSTWTTPSPRSSPVSDHALRSVSHLLPSGWSPLHDRAGSMTFTKSETDFRGLRTVTKSTNIIVSKSVVNSSSEVPKRARTSPESSPAGSPRSSCLTPIQGRPICLHSWDLALFRSKTNCWRGEVR